MPPLEEAADGGVGLQLDGSGEGGSRHHPPAEPRQEISARRPIRLIAGQPLIAREFVERGKRGGGSCSGAQRLPYISLRNGIVPAKPATIAPSPGWVF